MTQNTLAIIQARMSSSRLPGKVLIDISGKPVLQHMLERVQHAKSLDGVVLATTTDPSDDILEQFCQKQDLPCYRGSLHDVLDRFYQAAVQFHAGVIVRLTADCPLIDPGVLDLTVDTFLGSSPLLETLPASVTSGHFSHDSFPYDFVADRLPPPWKRTLPIGLDVEVCSFEALQRAWQEGREPHQREHVMPYLYEGVSFPEYKPALNREWYIESGTTPRGFRVALLNHFPDYGSLRWTVDTAADLVFVGEILDRFGSRADFSWNEILTLLEKEPALALINAGVKHKSAFDVDHRRLSH